MAIKFLTIDASENDLNTARLIAARERELSSYYAEEQTHLKAIASRADLSWDETTEKYRYIKNAKGESMGRDEAIGQLLADGVDSEILQNIMALRATDLHKGGLEAVRAEIARVEGYYNELLEKLPAGKRRDNAFAALAAAQQPV